MFVLNEVNSIAHHFLFELRDVQVQQDAMRFRKNLERLGEILAYEVSKSLLYEERSLQTPLGALSIPVLKEHPILIPILRAGLPFYQGFLNFFDQAECGFIGAYRDSHGEKDDFDISLNYLAIPNISNKTIIIIDPMLATGRSLVKSLNELLLKGDPKHIHIVCTIAAPEGVEYLNQSIKKPFTLWLAAIDQKLNNLSYIVPGLGDAGDLSFGSKL